MKTKKNNTVCSCFSYRFWQFSKNLLAVY